MELTHHSHPILELWLQHKSPESESYYWDNILQKRQSELCCSQSCVAVREHKSPSGSLSSSLFLATRENIQSQSQIQRDHENLHMEWLRLVDSLKL